MGSGMSLPTVDNEDELLPYIDSFRDSANSFAKQMFDDVRQREIFMNISGSIADGLMNAYRSGVLLAQTAAYQATEFHNTLQELSRSTVRTQQTATKLGRLAEKYAHRFFKRPFDSLSKVQKKKVFAAIKKALDESKPRVRRKIHVLLGLGLQFWILAYYLALFGIKGQTSEKLIEEFLNTLISNSKNNSKNNGKGGNDSDDDNCGNDSDDGNGDNDSDDGNCGNDSDDDNGGNDSDDSNGGNSGNGGNHGNGRNVGNGANGGNHGNGGNSSKLTNRKDSSIDELFDDYLDCLNGDINEQGNDAENGDQCNNREEAAATEKETSIHSTEGANEYDGIKEIKIDNSGQNTSILKTTEIHEEIKNETVTHPSDAAIHKDTGKQPGHSNEFESASNNSNVGARQYTAPRVNHKIQTCLDNLAQDRQQSTHIPSAVADFSTAKPPGISKQRPLRDMCKSSNSASGQTLKQELSQKAHNIPYDQFESTYRPGQVPM